MLVDDRKIAGILLESRPAPASPVAPSPAATAASASIIALGIGINIAQRSFPPELAMRATSVRLAGGDVDRDTLLTALLDALDAWRARLEGEGFAPVRERWRALADTLGRRVSVDGVTGTAVDVDGDGALLIDDGVAWRRVLGGVVSEVD